MSAPQLSPGWNPLLDYSIDASQRWILFMDTFRRRGNNYFDHLRRGQPPVLSFPYEMILDGRGFDRPVNYALVQIQDRRVKDPVKDAETDRRELLRGIVHLPKRPIVIIDPRAGHGPGIGGSKRDSEIGVALNNGHPVYFILFYTDPMPGQTLADIEQAEVLFLEEISHRHPYLDKPAVIGNCQAGWAAALLCADRPDLAGLLVLNGAPLSYWSGVEGRNPMRYKGGLGGGAWMNSLLSDLGNGKFDGAHLVSNFEGLNPANTYWKKEYGLYAQIDTEAERYLNFEKWWGGFYLMNADEIRFIVSNLFVGDKLERGELELHEGKAINLKNIDHPIVVFASKGDNITPPQQALNWITRVYRSEAEIREQGQVIVYIVHENIGHLGIFVSGLVARKEHQEIIGNFDMIDYLPPGLYEMVIDEREGPLGVSDFRPRFQERTFADLLSLDDEEEEEEDFRPVATVSEINDSLYRLIASPWIRLLSTEGSAEALRLLHPLRLSRILLSDLNPWLMPFKQMAPLVKEHRQPVPEDNPFVQMERNLAKGIEEGLNLYRDTRDRYQEIAFRMIYGFPLVHQVFKKPRQAPPLSQAPSPVAERFGGRMESGGFREGIVRIMLAMANVDRDYDRREYAMAEKIVTSHRKLRKIRPAAFKAVVKEQACILQIDTERALKALGGMIPDPADRSEALSIARRIALADGPFKAEESAMLEKIKGCLKP